MIWEHGPVIYIYIYILYLYNISGSEEWWGIGRHHTNYTYTVAKISEFHIIIVHTLLTLRVLQKSEILYLKIGFSQIVVAFIKYPKELLTVCRALNHSVTSAKGSTILILNSWGRESSAESWLWNCTVDTNKTILHTIKNFLIKPPNNIC